MVHHFSFLHSVFSLSGGASCCAGCAAGGAANGTESGAEGGAAGGLRGRRGGERGRPGPCGPQTQRKWTTECANKPLTMTIKNMIQPPTILLSAHFVRSFQPGFTPTFCSEWCRCHRLCNICIQMVNQQFFKFQNPPSSPLITLLPS